VFGPCPSKVTRPDLHRTNSIAWSELENQVTHLCSCSTASAVTWPTWNSREAVIRPPYRAASRPPATRHRSINWLINWLVVWHGANTLSQINEVSLQQAQLVVGWVDCLRASKPSLCETTQQGQLSLLPSTGWKNDYQLLGWVVINVNGKCNTAVASLSRSETQADWPGPKFVRSIALVLLWPNDSS